jgi:hypothetical protein
MAKIVFLLSAPRAGSTALQKLILSDPAVDSESESWWLLPLLAANEERDSLAVYGASGVSKSISSMKSEDWFKSIRAFYNQILENRGLDDNSVYLDKTPRYSIYSSKLINIFPDANFVVLSRNPLGILKSHQETWGSWWFRLPLDKSVLNRTFQEISYLSSLNHPNLILIDYNDLLHYPEKISIKLNKFLDIKSSTSRIDNTKRAGNTVFGDPNFGKKNINKIKEDNLKVEFSIYLYYLIYFKKKSIHSEKANVHISFKTITRLLTWPIFEIIAFFNIKAVYLGFREKFYR